ncbi:MAG: hypothetical protein GX862_04160 [Leucobacter sp.]|nr:hypothetical protein [Leucobacter sp.]
MTNDHRTNYPIDAQVEAAAKAMHGTRNPWFAAYGDWGAAGFEIKKAFRESARAALVAAAADAHLPTVEQIETRIKEAEHDWRNAEFVGDPDLGTLTKYVAHAVRALFGEVAGDE